VADAEIGAETLVDDEADAESLSVNDEKSDDEKSDDDDDEAKGAETGDAEAEESPIAPIAWTPLQDPFMPSSSPLTDTRRYLCWNTIGTITSRDDGAGSAVEIDFADKGKHHAVRRSGAIGGPSNRLARRFGSKTETISCWHR
jgi:chromosome transmission fidelity protein 4